jgi:hypothetical protein
MVLREISCKDGRWMKLAQDLVKRRALLIVVLKIQINLSTNKQLNIFWLVLTVNPAYYDKWQGFQFRVTSHFISQTVSRIKLSFESSVLIMYYTYCH